MAKPAALGKGLGALISKRPATPVANPVPSVEAGESVRRVGIDEVVSSPFQPRTVFRDEQIEELKESIREHGIVQPLICRERGGKYELVAGERRWRAARKLGLDEVPVIVREASDRDVLELALIENLQREDLNPIEEAEAFQRLAKDFSLKQDEIAQKVGKSRAAVANAVRLLDLDDQVQSWLTQGRLSVGHAKVLLGVKDASEQRVLADAVLRKGLTVRGVETLVAAHLEKRAPAKKSRRAGARQGLGPALMAVQNRLQRRFATHVEIHHGDKRGRIEIEYYGGDDLQRVLDLLGLDEE